MPPRATSRATAAIPVAAVAFALAGAASIVWADGGTGAAISLAATIVAVAVAGAVLALARPDNRVGWVMLAAGTAWGVGEGALDWAVRGIVTHPGTVPGASALAIAGSALRAAGWLGVAVGLPAIYPDGQLPGPRWRWLGWVVVADVVVTFAGTALDQHVENQQLQAAGWSNPLALGGLGDALALLNVPLLAVGVIGCVAGMITRWRHGGTPMRRQLLVFAIGAVLPLVVIPSAFGVGSPSWVFAASVLPFPIAAAAAVLTGGVFDLATVANRSLVWGTLTGAIVVMYALIIAGAGAVLGREDAPWLPWLGTAVVAVSFAPLRASLQNAANRVTYGQWRSPYAVLAGLGPRISVASDAERVLGDVVAELHSTLGLTGAALRDPAGRVIAGSPGPEPVAMPLTAYGRPAGDLLYTEPATPLRALDRRVLADLGAQLAILMHARSLTHDLVRARERLVLGREEERRRLRRDLHDGLGPALAGLMLKVDNARALVPADPTSADRDLLALRDDIQATVVDVRRLVEGLRPPAIDELGLGGALTQAVDRLTRGTTMTVSVDIDESLPVVPAAVEVALYRIVSEAVTNVVKHARASTCRVGIEVRDGYMVATVSDDGRFSANAAGGNGLLTMAERAEELGGTLGITTASGTEIVATLPLGRRP